MGTVLGGMSDSCGINYDIASGGYRCVISESCITVEGIKSVVSFSAESVLLSLKGCRLEIKGSNLTAAELAKGYIRIYGRAVSLSLI